MTWVVVRTDTDPYHYVEGLNISTYYPHWDKKLECAIQFSTEDKAEICRNRIATLMSYVDASDFVVQPYDNYLDAYDRAMGIIR